MESRDDVVRAIAREIERHFEAHPNAADTLEGIRSWWLTRERSQESLEQTQRALCLLEQRGLVAKTEQSGGGVIYFSASRKRPGNQA